MDEDLRPGANPGSEPVPGDPGWTVVGVLVAAAVAIVLVLFVVVCLSVLWGGG